MAAEQKYHIGKNGPAPCRANPDKPGGRSCRLGGDDRHGSKEVVTAIWERELLLSTPDYLAGLRSFGSADSNITAALERLSDPQFYSSASGLADPDSDELNVAMTLARSSATELSHMAIDHETRLPHEGDENRHVPEMENTTSVRRQVFEDGSAGYFKSFRANAEEEIFEDYGTTALGGAINEVNAYRMALLLGDDFQELVPKTSMRVLDGSIGTIQAEAIEFDLDDDDYEPLDEDYELWQEDRRRAALFDFVVGSLDRHSYNYIQREEKTEGRVRKRLSLIDNSFSFPVAPGKGFLNDSTLNESFIQSNWSRERLLRESEIVALGRARSGLLQWMDESTISEDRGLAAIDRIDKLLSENRICSFRDYHDVEDDDAEEY